MLWCLVPFGASLSIVLLYVTISRERAVFTLTICRDFSQATGIGWGSPRSGCVATYPTRVPLEEWAEEQTSKVTPKSNCHQPGHLAGLLSLLSQRQTTAAAV